MKSMVLLSLLTCSTCFAAGEVKIEIDINKSKGPVRELVFGQNFECVDSRGIFSLPTTAPAPRDFEVKYGQGYWDPAGKRPAPGVLEIMKTMPFGALRYPGGCLAHNFQWKKTVGPIEQRGSRNWAFGLDEYLELCRALNCEPQIIITDYAFEAKDIPQDAADLVEYLNMPAETRYPWAMKRAANGHNAPYRVKYFEIGNESSHGNHALKPSRCYSAAQYAAYFNTTVAAMKKVDPTIKVGLLEDYFNDWKPAVLSNLLKNADFLIVHSYYPQLDSLGPEDAFKGTMAGNEQFDQKLVSLRDRMDKAGRMLPIGLTEFNVRSIKSTATAYRFSYLAGMQASEQWCKYLLPESHILMANYWLLLNGMYGIVVTMPGGNEKAPAYTGRLIEYKAAARFFQTLKRFTGTEVLAAQTSGEPKVEAKAIPGVLMARGNKLLLDCTDFVAVPSGKYDFSRFNKPGLAVTGNCQERTLNVKFSDYWHRSLSGFCLRQTSDVNTGRGQLGS